MGIPLASFRTATVSLHTCEYVFAADCTVRIRVSYSGKGSIINSDRIILATWPLQSSELRLKPVTARSIIPEFRQDKINLDRVVYDIGS